MALDVAMGGSTNTILHLLAAAREAGVDFGLKEIDELSRRVPCLCKVAPATANTTSRTSTGPAASRRSSASSTGPGCSTATFAPSTARLAAASSWTTWDLAFSGCVRRGGGALPRRARRRPHHSSRTRSTTRWDTLDLDAANGCIRDIEHAYTKDGGLAVLYGNLAPEGAIVKTAGVEETCDVLRPGRGVREPGGRRRGHPRRPGQAR